MHSVTNLDYPFFVADCLAAASTCDGLYSGIVVQLHRETVQMQLMYFKCSHCVFCQTPAKTIAGVAGGIDRK